MGRDALEDCGYVHVWDALGNENALLGDMAAQAIPDVVIEYGGIEPWVDVRAESTVGLWIEVANSSSPVDVEAIQFDQDGKPLSLRRYQFLPAGHSWQIHGPPSGEPGSAEPLVAVDLNDDGTYNVDEQVPASHSSGSGPADTIAPLIGMTMSASPESRVVTFTSEDDVTPDPAIHYTLDDGPMETYSAPLGFSAGDNSVLRAFAIDAMGNTSGLIVSALQPRISSENGGGDTIVLRWPRADAYVFEEADDPSGTWSASPAAITADEFGESASIGTGAAQRKFFRLRSQAVTK